MIYDLTLGFNELDLFLIRYHELQNIVDKFVVVEATHTHSGNPKPLYFSNWIHSQPEGIDPDRVEIIVWDNGPSVFPTTKEYSWHRENYQREILGHWVKENCKPDDVCMLSDMDEIPNAEALNTFLWEHGLSYDDRFLGVWRFEQYLSYLFFNTVQGSWGGTKVFHACDIDMSIDRFMTLHIRYRNTFDGIIKGGWHFSSCFGIEGVKNKLHNFAHTECSVIADNGGVEYAYDNLVDPFNRNPLTVVDCNFLPRYVLNNLKYFKKYIYVQ